MSVADPIKDAEFAAAMAALQPFEPSPLLALAVSGGPDSMAMAWLAARWARAAGGDVVALVVNHGLRPEAASEARRAIAGLKAEGVRASLLTVDAPPPCGDIQAWARRERYRLLEAGAVAENALHLLTAHHQDDQAETLVLNLRRGSGARGLAAMRPRTHGPRVRVLRPLLGFPGARLKATAAASGLPIADDPSNRDVRFARVRVREAIGGETSAARLAETAARLATDDDAIEAAVAQLVAQSASISPLGMISLERQLLLSAPGAVAQRVLERATRAVGGRLKPPRRDRVIRALSMLAGVDRGRRTLGGAVLDWRERDLRIWREPGKRPPPRVDIHNNDALIPWDGRFSLHAQASGGLAVGPLGHAGLRAIEARDDRPLWIDAAPRQALAMTPALWRGEMLVKAAEFGGVSRSAGQEAGGADRVRLLATFRPARPLAPEGARNALLTDEPAISLGDVRPIVGRSENQRKA